MLWNISAEDTHYFVDNWKELLRWDSICAKNHKTKVYDCAKWLKILATYTTVKNKITEHDLDKIRNTLNTMKSRLDEDLYVVNKMIELVK